MNALYYGDNLDVLRQHVADESVDLVYLDPPFNSNRSYNVLFKNKSGDESQAQIEAFDDTWTWSQQSEATYSELVQGGAPLKVSDALEAMRRLLGDNDVLAYLVMMTARLLELHRVLKPTGSLYLHCDPTASHYLKVMLDAVFGPTRFRNEIIWRRTPFKGSSKARAEQLPRSHDAILFYSKGSTWTWQAPTEPYSDQYLARFKWDDHDGRGPYRKTLLKTYSAATAARLKEDDRWIDPVRPDAMPSYKQYLSESAGERQIDDVWTDINMLNPQAHERLGYPTQKPLDLLERIILASSNPGAVVLDPFCGCGTTIDAAQKLGRQWVGIDITYLAVDLISKRLRHTYGDSIAGTYKVHGIPHDLDGARALFNANPFDFERWAVSLIDGQPNQKQVGDKGIDGVVRFPVSQTETGRAIVSVKGGRQVNPAMVQELVGAVHQHKGDMGVFICMTPPTKGMAEVANHSGSYEHPLTGARYPRVQIVTITELLEGRRPKMPTAILPYVKAKARNPQQPSFEL